MYGLYELYTWDDVSYRQIGRYETEEEAEQAKIKAKEERKKVFIPCDRIPTDPVSYKVLSDMQYDLLMH